MKKNRNQNPTMFVSGQNVVGTINANGNASVYIDQKVIHQASPEMEILFKRIQKNIKERPQVLGSNKEKLAAQVNKIEREAAKGDGADKAKLKLWLDTLAKMAPDIIDVMAASLAGPVTGFTAVFKKIVDRAKSSQPG